MSTNTTNISTGHAAPPLASIVASACFVSLVMLLTIVGNSFVCFSVFYFRRLRSPTYYLIVSLAVSDLLVGLLSLPFRLSQTVNGEVWPATLGYHGCKFWIWIDFFCCGASILNLTVISIDRLFGIKQPLLYRERMTTKRAGMLIAFVWLYALICASLSFVKWNGKDTIMSSPQCAIITKVYITVAAFAAFFCPLVVLVCCYGIVLKIAFTHARRLQREKVSVAVNFLPAEQDTLTGGEESGFSTSPSSSLKAISIVKRSKEKLSDGNRNRVRSQSIQSGFQLMKQLKATKTLAIVVGIFILCWFPFFVIFLTFQYCPSCFDEDIMSSKVKTAIKVIFIYVLPVSNSAANPIIYTCFNQEFRRAFLRLVYKVLGKSPSRYLANSTGFSECS